MSKRCKVVDFCLFVGFRFDTELSDNSVWIRCRLLLSLGFIQPSSGEECDNYDDVNKKHIGDVGDSCTVCMSEELVRLAARLSTLCGMRSYSERQGRLGTQPLCRNACDGSLGRNLMSKVRRYL